MTSNRLTFRVRRLIVAEGHGTFGVFVLGLWLGVAAVMIALGVITGRLHLF